MCDADDCVFVHDAPGKTLKSALDFVAVFKPLILWQCSGMGHWHMAETLANTNQNPGFLAAAFDAMLVGTH